MRYFILCFATVLTISGCSQEKSNLLTKTDLEGRVFLGPHWQIHYFKGDTVRAYYPPFAGETYGFEDSWVGIWEGDSLVLWTSNLKYKEDLIYTFDDMYKAHPYPEDEDFSPSNDPIFEIKDTAVIDKNNIFKTLTSQPWQYYPTKLRMTERPYETNFFYNRKRTFYEDEPTTYFGFQQDSIAKLFMPAYTPVGHLKQLDSNHFAFSTADGDFELKIIYVWEDALVLKLMVNGEFAEYALFEPLVLDAVLPVITGEKLYH